MGYVKKLPTITLSFWLFRIFTLLKVTLYIVFGYGASPLRKRYCHTEFSVKILVIWRALFLFDLQLAHIT